MWDKWNRSTMTATVDTNTGKISQFHAGVKVAFGIER